MHGQAEFIGTVPLFNKGSHVKQPEAVLFEHVLHRGSQLGQIITLLS